MSSPTSANSSTPALFFDNRAYSFFNNISKEIIVHVARQKVLYYAIDGKTTKYDPLYGESKEKIWRPPVEIFCRIMFNEPETTTTQFSVDRTYKIDVYFQKEMLNKRLGMTPREGDFLGWDNKFFEILSVIEPQIISGFPEFKMAFVCNCQSSRFGIFEPTKQGISDLSNGTTEEGIDLINNQNYLS